MLENTKKRLEGIKIMKNKLNEINTEEQLWLDKNKISN